MRVLLAEDEETIAVTLRHALEDAGHRVTHAADTRAALAGIEREDPDVVVTDIRMPGGGGMEVLARSIELDSKRPVVLMTGYGTVEQAVEAMRIGAAHYIQKPFRNEAVVQLVERFARERALQAENERLRAELRAVSQRVGEMIGGSTTMKAAFDRIVTVEVRVPTSLSEAERSAIEQLAAASAGATKEPTS